ncbi:MAG: hypothetical protein Q7O66_09655, partial [Dehalococcoidia bacterium]|nr:hypothetical protein [Dehalococcoidia bacterium]
NATYLDFFVYDFRGVIVLKTCPVCGNPVERKGSRGITPTFCSAKCKRSGYDARVRMEARQERAAILAARPVRHYLSLGGGVNSVALMLWMQDQGIEFEAVYADVGTDWPATREYVDMLRTKGYPVTILDTRRNGLTLHEWCLKYNIMPSRMMRWCTTEWKVKPLARYFVKPAIIYIGIDAGEVWRAKPIGATDLEYRYPLIDADIDRDGCKALIEAHGLPLPEKSNCYVCPFQARRQFVRLRAEHPELYCTAKRMEDQTNARLKTLGHGPMYLAAGKPLDVAVGANQMDLFGESQVQPCLCGL